MSSVTESAPAKPVPENHRMNKYQTFGIAPLLSAFALGLTPVMAAKKQEVPPSAALTEAGSKLEAKYSGMLAGLQKEIVDALPKINEQQKAAFLKAYQEEAAAMAAERKTMLASAKAKDKDASAKESQAAKSALELATKNADAPTKAMLADLGKFLKSDALDAKLVKFNVLAQATPRGLAEFAQQGKEQEALVEKLLADDVLMKCMLSAGGAADGRYGQAMQIYTDIQKSSTHAKEGILERFALGTSLEQAVPVAQRNADDVTTGPATVDPVKRYMHYEKAFLAGELDPGFKDLPTWDCRYVANGDEPDDILTWGREMLQNYYPDQIGTADYRWRYVESVKTDVKYGSQDQKNDSPSLGFYQNIINTGGVCGRRAFFRSFYSTQLRYPDTGSSTARPCHIGPLDARRLGHQPRRKLGLGHCRRCG